MSCSGSFRQMQEQVAVWSVDSDEVRWHLALIGPRLSSRGGRCAMGTVLNGVSGRSTPTLA
jgi:hypothetical protein